MENISMSDSRASLNASQRSQNNISQYRRLIGDLPAPENNEIDSHQFIEKTEQVLRRAKDITEEATSSAGEIYIDSCLLRRVGELALHIAESVEVNTNVYDCKELAYHIRDNPRQWQFSLPSTVASSAFLYGTFEAAAPEQRPRAPRRRLQRQRAAAPQRPDTIDKLTTQTDEDSKMVDRVYRYIRQESRGAPLSYFHVALDPASFSRSVENVFYLAFLAKEGRVAITICPERGIPVIQLVSKEERESQKPPCNQFIVSLDMDSWEKLIEAFDIKEARMNFKRNGTTN